MTRPRRIADPIAGFRTGFATTDDGLQLHWRAVGWASDRVLQRRLLLEVLRAIRPFTVVTWDYRGHGRSDRRIDPREMDLGVPRHADDLAAVLGAVCGRTAPALLVGHSMGCQVALETRRRHPDLCAGLLLILGTAGKALETFSTPIAGVLPARAPIRVRVRQRVERDRAPAPQSPLAWFFF
jgi:pimeloyl-ACP methyl ester carboxylesterase